jgi:hypothetical protein
MILWDLKSWKWEYLFFDALNTLYFLFTPLIFSYIYFVLNVLWCNEYKILQVKRTKLYDVPKKKYAIEFSIFEMKKKDIL